MWGTQFQTEGAFGLIRFIPTYVGNTITTESTGADVAVHPHICGEHGAIYRLIWPVAGSSPHMWGTLNDPTMADYDSRFIPTYVGNT